MARVRQDEEKVAAEEKEEARRMQLAEGEARNAALHKKSLLRSGQILPVSEEPQQHVNLFEDLEQGKIVSKATNAECEKEKKEEREKYEKQIGYLTYLGQDTVEATGCVSWYNKLPDRSSSGSDSKEKKLPGDPLNDIRRYLDLGEMRRDSRKERHEEKGENKKCRESEHNEVRRANKKSKHKTYKDEKKKRARRNDSSTSSGSDTSAERADSQSSVTNLEKMRAQRLKREEEERKRSDALLAKLRGEADPKMTKSDPLPAITQLYHSQFNPHLARQNKL
ncbi:hypothetical protein Cfor_09422 [Coptotermes formosanus]|uniref:CBF1-interacting co-repressor CIR N-terminal domain-containing protein n=1 Tax=Coptotermes formosanus TaxID=36987 RepID=A0A6L2PWV3_COPFO|nr:hypothetical protein Cfor_09422 [Coptotermes formosanus]